ncbi:MAG: hypothetical protein JWM64_2257 [Frankiales bacterium]|nr:hypothetical protein [Frankiales bacterium]
MASAAEVELALRDVVSRLAEVDPATRGKHVLDRTVSCRVTDLDVVWTAQLGDDGLSDLTDEPCDNAQVRLRVASDDLVALAEGRLAVVTAWATGRLRVEASARDLMKLRTLL